MPGRHHRSRAGLVALIAGGSVGAVIRYALATAWPLPHQLLLSTTVTAGLAFAAAGYVAASAVTSPVRCAVAGVCGSVASLSAYSVLTVTQQPLMSIAFLTLTPAAAIGGLVCGRAAARGARR